MTGKICWESKEVILNVSWKLNIVVKTKILSKDTEVFFS